MADSRSPRRPNGRLDEVERPKGSLGEVERPDGTPDVGRLLEGGPHEVGPPADRALFDSWRRYYGGLLLRRRGGVYDVAVLGRLRRVRNDLRQLLDLREAGEARPADLEQMARAACFSKFHFLRLFRQAYGETPGRYLSQVRLERARLLLETTEHSVTEICFEVGFESLGSFSAAFRKHAGASPQQYRRRWLAVPALPLAARPRVPGCFVAMYS